MTESRSNSVVRIKVQDQKRKQIKVLGFSTTTGISCPTMAN